MGWDCLRSVNNSPHELPEKVNAGLQTLEGEIIDPKCYFGVMKRGFGKVYRSCASLCIAGGCPPVRPTTNARGTATYLWLTTPEGGKVHALVRPYIGRPLRIRGTVAKYGSWKCLIMNTQSIEWLPNPSIYD